MSLDSLIEFLRDEPNTPREAKHHDALNAVADVLEEERLKIKKHQATISSVMSGS